MKIIDVKAYPVAFPLEVPAQDATGVWYNWNTVIVKITAEDGTAGYGEIGPIHGGGIDIALWDLAGKLLETPVYQLLGGRAHQRIPAYASGFFGKDGRPLAPAECADEAKSYADQGFKGVKMKIGFGRRQDLLNLEAVRTALGPDLGIMVDANQGYSYHDVMKCAPRRSRDSASVSTKKPWKPTGRADVRPPFTMPPSPNVILILTDDQGYGDLACHGNPWLRTPAPRCPACGRGAVDRFSRQPDHAAAVRVERPAGRTRLQTFFTEETGVTRGAYHVYARLLGGT